MTNRDFSRNERKINVLIVDDHPMFRDGLQKALEMEDDLVVVGTCDDGERALLTARTLRPDVVLLDINLPGMNGLQVSRQLKSERPAVSVVVLTAYHDSQQVLHAMRAGASAYCVKDITPERLVSIIRDATLGYFTVGNQRMDEATLQQ